MRENELLIQVDPSLELTDSLLETEIENIESIKSIQILDVVRVFF